MIALTTRAKLFIFGECIAALAVVTYAATQVSSSDWLVFLVLLGLAVVTGTMKVTMPRVPGTLSISYVFLMWGIVHISLAEILVIGWAASLVQSYWKSKHRPTWIQIVFNLSAISLSIGAGSAVVNEPLLRSLISMQFPRLFLAAIAYFAVNTWSVSTVIGVTENKSPWAVWRASYFWSFPHYLVSASVVGAVDLFRQFITLELTLILLPVAYLVYRSFFLHVNQLSEALERTELEKRHAEETTKLHLSTIRALEEKKDLEQQFRQVQKMDAIGRLAGGVAHDFNNLLMVINGYSDLLLKKTDSDHPSMGPLTEIKKAGLRAAALTKQLLAFSRKQVLQTKVLELNQIIQDVLVMVRRVVPENVAVTTTLAGDLGQVEADPSHIDQIIMNLVVNARDAMPDGGRLHFETRNAEFDAASLREHPDVKPGPFAVLSVRDTGTGMTPEVLSQIFEPFFTTKAEGAGTGLGLATVFGVVKQAGGFIGVESEPGAGTQFHIYLPRLASRVSLVEDSRPAAAVEGGTETILLVEDQLDVLQLVRTILESYGYKVLAASDPVEALREACEYDGKIHMLLSDVVMPGFSGPDLAEQFIQERPDIKLLFMSGYAKDLNLDNRIFTNAGFLQKPVNEAELAAKVREVLGPAQRVTAPAMPKPAPTEPESKSLSSLHKKVAPRPHLARIVVVDDEIGVRSFVADVLEAEGYDVVTLEDGDLVAAEAAHRDIDLLITDLIMPNQEGIQTILQVRKRWPGMKVIAMSGAFGGRFLDVASKLGAHQTITKPILPDQLIEAVAKVLASSVDQTPAAH